MKFFKEFLKGMGLIIMFPKLTKRGSLETDAKALRSDWEKVGNNIRTAMKKFDKENKNL